MSRIASIKRKVECCPQSQPLAALARSAVGKYPSTMVSLRAANSRTLSSPKLGYGFVNGVFVVLDVIMTITPKKTHTMQSTKNGESMAGKTPQAIVYINCKNICNFR